MEYNMAVLNVLFKEFCHKHSIYRDLIKCVTQCNMNWKKGQNVFTIRIHVLKYAIYKEHKKLTMH